MLREATPEVIRSSVGVGDGAQASSPLAEDAWSSPVSCYMGDGDGGDDNLSIELNSLFAMLDGHPDSSRVHEDDLLADPIEENRHFGKASPPEDGDLLMSLQPVEELKRSRDTLLDDSDASSFQEGSGLVSLCEGVGNQNNLNLYDTSSELVNPYDSHLIDTSRNASYPPDSLCLSTSGNENVLVNYRGCSAAPSLSGSFEYQKMQFQIPVTSGIPVHKSIHDTQFAERVNDIQLGFREGQESGQGRARSRLKLEAELWKDKSFISSSDCLQQTGARGSSHFMPIRPNGFDSAQNDVCTNDSLNTNTQAVELCRTASYSSSDPALISENILTMEFNNDGDGELTYNSLNDSPVNMNFPEYYGGLSAESTSRPVLPDQLSQSFTSTDRKHMTSWKDKAESPEHKPLDCLGNRVTICLPEETFYNSMLDSYLVDSDSSLSEMSCSETKNIEAVNPQYLPTEDSLSLTLGENYSNGHCKPLPSSSKRSLPDSFPFIQNKKPKAYMEHIKKEELMPSQWPHHSVEGVRPVFPVSQSGTITNLDEDPDVCIIDDITNVGLPTSLLVPKTSQVGPPRYGFSNACQPRVNSSRLQSDDVKLTFQIALQDLAQPKLEASPPDGVLTVPLLRHQRIALSWMVQKETLNLQCSGGILADDQGLGKTVSTIALILMERSPPSKSCTTPAKGEVEALNLDEDDEFANPSAQKQENQGTPTRGMQLKTESSPLLQKGRPAAGTLVVCPTSVLRQWADELKQKVTSEANLSFLVYHGSNRTRDPNELIKYDVVLTTYSIVSMEVPTRSVVDKGDGEKGGADARGFSMEPTSGRKKKSSSSNLKDLKTEDSRLHSAARPLAKVGWFRVILDEAQTIKNHRTQVARACWGLRAKRRWCLSGTPIQNAIDDLYSYFRFLRYEPFSVYNSFCSKIKVPINRDPNVGYRTLQAVLKTIMLRRTKGTLIDGKPIINLPPRTINLKKVDFSKEERDFYSRLEAESREKFQGYADAGTVKQNYVNILLMLLRLRQACDHPLLVKGYDSSSIWRSSVETAKKIPRDKQIGLLNCLESCLALCTLCNDPPEDAVVTICGHVFCNQCISEHLTGDDDHCPSAKCKVKLTGASVFSKATLKSCLSGLSGHDCPQSAEMAEPPEAYTSSDSAKIKAAVEILQSLPTYYVSMSGYVCCPPDDKFTDSTQNARGTASSRCTNDENDKVCPEVSNFSKALVSEKAIVFSQWTRMLDLLEAKLKSSSIQYRRLDGTMSVAARDKAVKDFNTLPEVTVMIMSLKAASLGLNMVAACHVLLLDLWWNPTTEDQAIDRAHRIGQTRPVTVSRLTVENTVEDRILALQEKKREMVASAFGEDGSGSHQSRLTLEDLRYLFRV